MDKAAKALCLCTTDEPSEQLAELLTHLKQQTGTNAAREKRLAVLIGLRRSEEVRSAVPDAKSIEGRVNTLLAQLKEAGIHVLPGGSLENHLPSYTGSPYSIATESKAVSVNAELAWLETEV